MGILFVSSQATAQEANLQRRDAIVRVVQTASPAVVNINTETRVQEQAGGPFGFRDPVFDQFFREFFDTYSVPRERVQESLGSGAIIDPGGVVLTNEHVVELASRIRVGLADGSTHLAEVIGADPETDIAVLQLQFEGRPGRLPTLSLGRSADVLIGETVIAIGNPLGLSHTVTAGVVSALHRSVRTGDRVYQDFIQTDASINPGNSGGPLLNILGETIGINTAIVASAQGIGFAIPIDRAKRIVTNLLTAGEVSTPWFGARVQTLDEQLSAYFGLTHGAVITRVESGSPAERAGLQKQDVILTIAGAPVHYREDVYSLVRGYRPGDSLTVEFLREGQRREVDVRVTDFPKVRAEELADDLLGLQVQKGRGGLVVTRVRKGGPGARIGLQPGDVLAQIDSRPLRSLDDLHAALLKARGQASILLHVQRGRFLYRVAVEI
ncbi:MAG: PDZ domain-containing protein [Nitrospirae bacterium]|nr:PDZ domain-containing protein [Nitrospirota bacterium]